MANEPTVAGIDVGGDRKGCHLVVLRGYTVILVEKGQPEQVANAAIASGASAIGIDSPCKWATDGGGRAAEMELAEKLIFCFSTPTKEKALSSVSGFYRWMLNGERVFQALSNTHPLLDTPRFSQTKTSFETFPHAITCAMLGTKIASAKLKRTQRRQLLEETGINTQKLRSIDAIDAALCALTARHLIDGRTRYYGNTATGLIVVPRTHLNSSDLLETQIQ